MFLLSLFPVCLLVSWVYAVFFLCVYWWVGWTHSISCAYWWFGCTQFISCVFTGGLGVRSLFPVCLLVGWVYAVYFLCVYWPKIAQDGPKMALSWRGSGANLESSLD